MSSRGVGSGLITIDGADCCPPVIASAAKAQSDIAIEVVSPTRLGGGILPANPDRCPIRPRLGPRAGGAIGSRLHERGAGVPSCLGGKTILRRAPISRGRLNLARSPRRHPGPGIDAVRS